MLKKVKQPINPVILPGSFVPPVVPPSVSPAVLSPIPPRMENVNLQTTIPPTFPNRPPMNASAADPINPLTAPPMNPPMTPPALSPTPTVPVQAPAHSLEEDKSIHVHI